MLTSVVFHDIIIDCVRVCIQNPRIKFRRAREVEKFAALIGRIKATRFRNLGIYWWKSEPRDDFWPKLRGGLVQANESLSNYCRTAVVSVTRRIKVLIRAKLI